MSCSCLHDRVIPSNDDKIQAALKSGTTGTTVHCPTCVMRYDEVMTSGTPQVGKIW